MEATATLGQITLDHVFNDIKGRKAGLIKALSTDLNKFYQKCNPEMKCLCLYGLPNETWEVSQPVEEVPPELPEPALGINIARDSLEAKYWLSYVAVQGDSWLLAVAFYLCGRYGFGKSEREKLFDMINEEPTVFEAITGAHVKPAENNGNKNKSSDRMPSGVFKMSAPSEEDESGGDEEEEDEEETACGTCGGIYAEHEFWICCDVCERWFHGKCVKITAAKADHIKLYKCPTCKSKKAKKAVEGFRAG